MPQAHYALLPQIQSLQHPLTAWEDDFYKIDAGLKPALIEQISKEKNEPEWMKEFRLHSLEIYNKLQVPDWGPSIEGLHMD